MVQVFFLFLFCSFELLTGEEFGFLAVLIRMGCFKFSVEGRCVERNAFIPELVV